MDIVLLEATSRLLPLDLGETSPGIVIQGAKMRSQRHPVNHQGSHLVPQQVKMISILGSAILAKRYLMLRALLTTSAAGRQVPPRASKALYTKNPCTKTLGVSNPLVCLPTSVGSLTKFDATAPLLSSIFREHLSPHQIQISRNSRNETCLLAGGVDKAASKVRRLPNMAVGRIRPAKE